MDGDIEPIRSLDAGYGTDPATGERPVGQALADAADVDRAVQAVRLVYLSGAPTAMRSVERAARPLRAGQVFVNGWHAGGLETPFGGIGRSGHGRETGREALWNYVQTKTVAIRPNWPGRHPPSGSEDRRANEIAPGGIASCPLNHP